MNQPVFNPAESGSRMTVACFISGSGTNYREIVARNPSHRYIVFTNRPDCSGADLALSNGHTLVILSHIPFLREARKKYGPGKVPRNCPEREQYEREVCRLIELEAGQKPDLVCLAGYDQWTSDWMVERYFPHILNVHPGDTTKGYDGLYWVPSAKAILAGDQTVRSTLFFVDKGEDTGPVFIQSAPLDIMDAIAGSDRERELREWLGRIIGFATEHGTGTWEQFQQRADEDLRGKMGEICQAIQNALRTAGDWEIYPLGVSLIAEGRVEVSGRTVRFDGKELPKHGYRPAG